MKEKDNNANKVDTKKRSKTVLTWDNYIRYLIEALDESNFMKRAEIKPMSTPKAPSESHLTTRSIHSRMAANIAKRIAEGLNLNGDYIYAGMLAHDAGHPFSAHEGEEIFSLIGKIYGCGFFHHNAKGVEVIRSENIMEKAINKIPNIDNNPGLRKKLEKEFPYFLDVIISHDGEASRRERKKEPEHYDTIEEAVNQKLTKANAQDDYKFVAQTPEGRIAKIADVIAYLATDILDGFRTGIINDFDDEYLELFGKMFTTGYGYSTTREEYIACAKNILNEIKAKRVRELRNDIEDENDRKILGYAKDIINTAEKKGIKINTMSENDVNEMENILEEKIQQMCKDSSKLSDEEKQFLNADISKLKDFVEKLTSVHSDVVQEVVSRMQDYFISDVLANSQEETEAQFSEKAEKLFDQIKAKNYKAIVQFSKWDYQTAKQPIAAKELVTAVAQNLIKTGVIRDKFYDRKIRSRMNPEEMQHMKVSKKSEQAYTQYKSKIGIRNIKNSFKSKSQKDRYRNLSPHTIRKYELYRDVYCYTQKEGENFAVKYKNVYNAIPTTVRMNVEQALEENMDVIKKLILAEELINIKGNRKDEKSNIEVEKLMKVKTKLEKQTKTKSFLREFQCDEIKRLQDRMTKEYRSLEEAKMHKEEFIQRMIEEEKQKMEEKIAIQIAIDYLGGMTDSGFNDLAIKTGYMKYNDVNNSERGKTPSESVQRLIEKNARENDENDENDER